jgi:hypothetical protein
MDFWRKADNPWGEEVLIGVSWDLMWFAIIGSVVFLVGHAVWLRTRLPAFPRRSNVILSVRVCSTG